MGRLLYVGPLGPGSTSLDRMSALRDLGLDVVPFDTIPFTSSVGRLWRSFAYRTALGPQVRALNRALRELPVPSHGLDRVWIDKGNWIYPETITGLRDRLRAPIVHYTPDPAILFHHTRHFMRSIPIYDACITTKVFELDLYRRRGAKQLILTHQAYERSRFYPRPPTPAYASDVTLIGHYEEHYARAIASACEVAPRVRLWGEGWGKGLWRHPRIRPAFQGGPIYGEEYCKALSSAKICLGVVSKWIPETSTTRTFEIPAAGSMLLAERTDQHQAFFREDEEAVFFSSIEEMKDKLRYYLDREPLRQKIAKAGRARCESSGYSNHDRLAAVLRELGE